MQGESGLRSILLCRGAQPRMHELKGVSGGPRRSSHGAACSGRKALAGAPDNQEDAEEGKEEQRISVVYLLWVGPGISARGLRPFMVFI